MGKIDKKTFPTYQKQYGAGYSDIYQKDGFLYFDVDGDGVKFDPNLMVYHWDAFDPASPNYHKKAPWVAANNDPSTFYKTGYTTNNSAMLDGSAIRVPLN